MTHSRTPPASPTNRGPFEVREEPCSEEGYAHQSDAPAVAIDSGVEGSTKCKVVSLRERRNSDPSDAVSVAEQSSATPTAIASQIEKTSLPLSGAPERRYDCSNYDACLDLAASLNWESFTCEKCCGEINSALLWRAHQNQRKDSVAKALCGLRPIEKVDGHKS